MSKFIGLCGAAGAGKDTAAAYLVEDGWVRIAFADPLKQVLYDLDITTRKLGASTEYKLQRLVDAFGWDWVKVNCPEVRGLLQRLGVSVRDNVNGDAWLNAAFKDLDFNKNYVFTDCRFPNECEKIKKYGRSALVLIDRPGQANIAGNHVSELAWRDQEFDHTIVNKYLPRDLGLAIRAVAAEL